MAGISYEYRTSAAEVSHSYLDDPVAELLADEPPNALVVDIGCGNGSFLSLFQSRGGNFMDRITPLPVSKLRGRSCPNIKFSLGNAESIPEELTSKAGQFDVVLCTEVIEHVYNPRGLLKTCHICFSRRARWF
jgi:2-polyprenyl-3-methyl-5-hydroxy-6-metoxy-1,4-benzoquinol methylase